MKVMETANWIYFKFTYNDYKIYANRIEKFIKALKRHIPVNKRHYYPKKKEWMIAREYYDCFKNLREIYITKSQMEIWTGKR